MLTTSKDANKNYLAKVVKLQMGLIMVEKVETNQTQKYKMLLKPIVI